MIVEVNLNKILFIDIETVAGKAHFEELEVVMQAFWEKKFQLQKKKMPERYQELTMEDAYKQEAAIFAEFGKIVCISVGMITLQAGTKHFRVKSYSEHSEHQLLTDFASMLRTFTDKQDYTICGHNIKEFDIPYIARRMLVNQISLPSMINIAGKKPWEVKFIDTLDLWKFGDYKNFTSLSLLAALFNIPTPKDDIDGSEVGQVYYEENNLQRIAKYCEKDVIATAQLFLKMNGEPLMKNEHIAHV